MKDPISCLGKPAVIGVAPSEEIRKNFIGYKQALPKFQTLAKQHKQRIDLAFATVVGNWFVEVEICIQSLDSVTGINQSVLTDFEKPYTVAIEQPLSQKAGSLL